MDSEHSHAPMVDAHCHIDLFPDPTEIVKSASANKIHTIAVTNAPFVFKHTLELSKQSQYVHPALGLHPELVQSHGDQLPSMLELMSQTRFIGEVGLDYVTTHRENRAYQARVFEAVLGESRRLKDRVISIHSRRAAREVITAVGSNFPGTIILHWFSGTGSDLKRAVANGFWFSVNMAMLNSESGIEIVKAMPSNRVLTETDGPFVKIAGSPQKPTDIGGVLISLSQLWRVAPEEAKRIVHRNFVEATEVSLQPSC